MTTDGPRRTPLYSRHLALGGRMVDFGGWELPQQYTSIREEHLAVRRAAGLFDISHMGRVRVAGPAAADFLQTTLTNDIAGVASGHAVYTLMCREDGGVIDDLVVYREGAHEFIVVVNAANRDKDIAWLNDHLPAAATLVDESDEVSLIALQGPAAQKLLPVDSAADLDSIPYFGFRRGRVAGVDALISRTGYTGEDGFELFVASPRIGQAWDAILEAGQAAGAVPAGLGARDATRLEAALRLYGNDMDETVNPYEAGLGWTVKLKKGDFIGRQALADVRANGPRRTLIGLQTAPGEIPRHGASVFADDEEVGAVTSGTHSFFLGHPVALALVKAPSLPVGSAVEFDLRGRKAKAEIVRLPFYRGSARSMAAAAKP